MKKLSYFKRALHAGVVRIYAVQAANGSSEHQSLDHQDCLQVLIVERGYMAACACYADGCQESVRASVCLFGLGMS
jgi:hypothetical protein